MIVVQILKQVAYMSTGSPTFQNAIYANVWRANLHKRPCKSLLHLSHDDLLKAVYDNVLKVWMWLCALSVVILLQLD